ncbi:MAG TPA: hypothetical protein VGN23_06265 [Verrucomicrobiae bacterium]|jgi:hypothetical protein
MKSLIKITLVAFVLAFVGNVSAQNNINGTWKSQFDSQIGKQNYTFELKADGTNLTGRAIGERQIGTNDVAITGGKIDGDKVSFNEPMTIQDNSITVEYTGTIDGDELKLHRKIGDLAEYDIVAKRATDAAPAQGSVDGKWHGQFDSQIGSQDYTFTFKMDGSTLTGRAYGIRSNGTNDLAITEGKVSQEDISFVEPLSFNGNDIRIEYTGKISGDEIKLHRKVGDIAQEDLVVKRVKDGAP